MAKSKGKKTLRLDFTVDEASALLDAARYPFNELSDDELIDGVFEGDSKAAEVGYEVVKELFGKLFSEAVKEEAASQQ